jgi:uroporphyrinogen-III synthase
LKVKKILVSQPKPETGKSPYIDLEEKHKVKVTFRPFIKVESVTSREFRAQKVNIQDHSAIVFTSIVGIKHFFSLAQDMRVAISDDMRYFCISASVANYLQNYINYRKRKVFYPESGHLADMLTLIDKHADLKYFVALPENDSEKIVEAFKERKVEYSIGYMYRTVSNDFTPEEEFDYDMLLFFSPQGIAALKKNFPDFEQGEIVIGCLGPTTAAAAREANLRIDIEVPSPKYTSMTVAVDDFIKENHKRR